MTRVEQGNPADRHPTWGSTGRPILIGDRCAHAEYGKGRVAQVLGSAAKFRTDKGVSHRVHVAELSYEFVQVEALANVDSWLAALAVEAD